MIKIRRKQKSPAEQVPRIAHHPCPDCGKQTISDTRDVWCENCGLTEPVFWD